MDLLDAIRQGAELADKATGGRALRGLAAGRPRELASVIPFSDTMGWTNPGDLASGRDVTNRLGLTDPSSQGWGSTAAGFGADMLLSPLNLAGGVGAFRAAPTVGKGLAAAAKSMSGITAAEELGRGAVKGAGALADAIRSPGVGRFMANETGALKIPGFGGAGRGTMGAAEADLAARAAWDKVSHHVIGKKPTDMAANNAFADAVESMGLHPDVENRLFDAQHRAHTFGNPWATADERLGGQLRDAVENAGESFFGGEEGALKSPGQWSHNPVTGGLNTAMALGGGVLGAETGRELTPEHPWAGATTGTLLGALGGHALTNHPRLPNRFSSLIERYRAGPGQF